MNRYNLNFRTDMADERVDTYKRVNNLSSIDGIKVTSNEEDGVTVTTVDVLNENGERAVLKKVGKYITMQIQDADCLENDDKEAVSNKLAEQISNLIGDDKEKSILVVGLGNMYVTPDALGPKVVKDIEVTRHLLNFAKEFVTPGTREVSAISPGVLGTTGIETSEIVTSIVKSTNPDILIVIDSLASQSVSRIGNTIQLSNTGITPGAGVRNKRAGINKETLGIPVIAIGVPTVVDMATITNEAIDKMLDNTKKEIEEFTNTDKGECGKVFDMLNKETRYDMIANTLDTENYIVTPKEVDELIDTMSRIIASGINISA